MKKKSLIAVCAIVVIAVVLFIFLKNDSNQKDNAKLQDEGYALEIFGNADGNWYVDKNDIAALKKMIKGILEEGSYADANKDGKIDEKDIEQVQKIIDGNEDYLWILDGNKKEQRISMPINRIGVEYLSNAELVNVLGASDRTVALDMAAYILRDIYFPGRNNLMELGPMYSNPAFERILGMDLDLLLTFSPTAELNDLKNKSLPDTDVVFLGLYWPNVIEPENSRFLQGVIKAGYILGAEERAYSYAKWLLGVANQIKDGTGTLAESDKPSVLMTSYNKYFQDGETLTASIYTEIDPLSQACMLAGGRPIAEDLPEWTGEGGVYGTKVGMEWIMEKDPDYIFAHSVRYTYSGIARDPSYGYDENNRSACDAAVEYSKVLPLLQNMSAIKNNHFYITAGDFRNNAMGGILGASYLAKVMHPDLFTDFDPQSIHQQFITDWMGLDYDLSNRGVFIAPAID